ncbi:hypothetical protein MMC08_006584 [Hypocenomyce scalaris]|nr:hypothetical protein [Hypocenomyce scalaris]
MATQLMGLPHELFDHIISYLDVEPPSLRALHKEPSITLTDSDAHPLKNLSLASRSLRHLTFFRLFKFSRIRLIRLCTQDIVELSSGSEDVNDFLDFIRLNALRSHVKGLVLYTEVNLGIEMSATGPRQTTDCFGNTGFFGFAHVWRTILTALNPGYITMTAPPSTLALLSSCVYPHQDEWAFDMPFQMLHFQQPDNTSIAVSLGEPRVADIFYLRRWSHCTLNEGSSLKAYSTYEYFLKATPSIAYLHSPQGPMTWFTSFDYIAIFPFYNHTDDILRLLLAMPNLRKMRMQLTPEPSSKILEDEKRMQNLSDMWMELDTGYTLIIYAMTVMGKKLNLKEFESLDYAMEGLRPTLDAKFGDKLQGWRRCGWGRWTRDTSLDPTLEPVLGMG